MLGKQASDELEPDAVGGPPRFTQRLRALEAQLLAQRVCVLDPLLAVRQVSPASLRVFKSRVVCFYSSPFSADTLL